MTTTALDFIARGMVFRRSHDRERRLGVLGPKGDRALLASLRAEVDRRVRMLGAGAPRGGLAPYCCDLCGDPIGHDKLGSCVLCGMVDADGARLCSWQSGGSCLLCDAAAQKRRDNAAALAAGSEAA